MSEVKRFSVSAMEAEPVYYDSGGEYVLHEDYDAGDKQFSEAVGLMHEVSYYVGSSYSRANLELCQRFDNFLTLIEQDKENDQ